MIYRMTQEERAAISFDLFLTGLTRLLMIGQHQHQAVVSCAGDPVAGSRGRAIFLLEGALDGYTDHEERRDDRAAYDVMRRMLAYLRGEDDVK